VLLPTSSYAICLSEGYPGGSATDGDYYGKFFKATWERFINRLGVEEIAKFHGELETMEMRLEQREEFGLENEGESGG
jgi:hypothetical protein